MFVRAFDSWTIFAVSVHSAYLFDSLIKSGMESFPVFVGISLFLGFLAMHKERSRPFLLLLHSNFERPGDASIPYVQEQPLVWLHTLNLLP